MKTVVDTSAILGLYGIGRLELLNNLYDKLISPPGVFAQILYPKEVAEFMQKHVSNVWKENIDMYNFDSLIGKYRKELNWEGKKKDPIDLQVYVTYVLTNADEMLFANKGAKNRFGKHGNVRELADLYRLAEEKRLFNREKSISFIEALIESGYRADDLRHLKAKLL